MGSKTKAKKGIKKKPKNHLVKISKPEPNSNPSGSSEIRALSYVLDLAKGALRHIFLKKDPSNEVTLVISNIPPFFDQEGVKDLISHATKTSVREVVFKKTTALDVNVQTGYRSGSVVFSSQNDCKIVLEECEQLQPISISELRIKLQPMGVKKYVRKYNSQFLPVEQLQESVKTAVALHEKKLMEEVEEQNRKRSQPDEEGWVTVTKHDKFSFRGKVNAPGLMEKFSSDNQPARKKRRKF